MTKGNHGIKESLVNLMLMISFAKPRENGAIPTAVG